MRNREYQKNLVKIIEDIKKENPNFYVGSSCIGEICLVNNCGKDATHKIGEEILDGDPHPRRHNLTNYVCCEHYQMVLGNLAKLQCEGQKHDLYSEQTNLLSGL
jgi:hypothetical protein